MPAAQLDLAIASGGTVEFIVDVVGGPATLEGYAGAMMVRERRNDTATLAVLPPGAVTVNPSTRQVTVRIPSSATEAYTWRRGVYDVKITGELGDAWILVEGRITNKRAVTRED